MPIYIFRCEKCREKICEVVRPMSQSGDIFICPTCDSVCQRVYSFNQPKEFFPYSDEQYGCEINSKKQERQLMKQHGHLDTRETPQYEKFKRQRSLAKRKPTYFTSAGVTHMERD